MKFFSRSSRATGPKIRVPRGFKSLSMMTIALLSKRRSEPSSRFTGCLVRTITARTTSPFFTVPVALASFTFAVITSPIRAYSVAFPITPIIVAMRAPVLSATSSLERICTINLFPDDFDQAPPLQFAERPRFHDANGIAVLCFVLLVVRVKFLLLLDNLAEFRVRHAGDSADDDRFVHPARNHFAYPRLTRTALRLWRGGSR